MVKGMRIWSGGFDEMGWSGGGGEGGKEVINDYAGVLFLFSCIRDVLCWDAFTMSFD